MFAPMMSKNHIKMTEKRKVKQNFKYCIHLSLQLKLPGEMQTPKGGLYYRKRYLYSYVGVSFMTVLLQVLFKLFFISYITLTHKH